MMTAARDPGQPAVNAELGLRKRIALVLARVGRPRLRRLAVDSLIGLSDLPGTGWRELGTGTWRFGVGEKGKLAQRARKTGEFTALRRFRNDEASRGAMAQVLPMANEEDAHIQVKSSPSSGIRWSGVTTLEERVVEGIEVPGADQVVAWERRNVRDNREGWSRAIAGNVGKMVFLVTCTSQGDGCPWSEVVTIATSQAARLH